MFINGSILCRTAQPISLGLDTLRKPRSPSTSFNLNDSVGSDVGMRGSLVFAVLLGIAIAQDNPTPAAPEQPTKSVSAADLVDLPQCAVSVPPRGT